MMQIGLKKMYSVLSFLTRNIRSSYLIKLKIAIGFALLGAKSGNSQTLEFPNRIHQPDTLKLDIELEEDIVSLCYEVVVVDYKSKEPKYIGGQSALNKFVRENVQYPKEAIEKGIEGNIAVNLTINEKGEIIESSILRKLGYGLDEEALRLVQLIPKMKPGKVKGKKTQMNKTIVFYFELPK